MQREIKLVEGMSYECESQWGIALQLLLSHMLVAGVTIGLFIWFSVSGLSSILAIGSILLLGSSLGLVLTWNIRYTLCLLSTTLRHLSQGLPVELSAYAWWYWPFKESFAALRDLDQWIKRHAEHLQLSREYRTQLLQQASYTTDLEQRHRRAGELQEQITQQISRIRQNLAVMQTQRESKDCLDESAQAALEDIQYHTKDMQTELQALQQQLYSTTHSYTSLTTALQTLMNTLSDQTGAALHVTLGDLPDTARLPRPMQELIFRIAQEAGDNIARHAAPQHIWFTLEQQGQALQLKIRDDGQGFDLAQIRSGIGLAHMHEQAAALKSRLIIQSQSGQGTTIHVIIPLLRTLPEQIDQRHQAWENRRTCTNIDTHIQLGEWSSLATLLFIVLYECFGILPADQLCFTLMLVFSLCSIIYNYLRAHILLSQLALTDAEQMHEVQTLRLRLRRWHLWKYQLALAGCWYFVALLQDWHDGRIVLELVTASCGLFILLIREHCSELTAKQQQYTQLAHIDRQWELQRWQQALKRQSRGWFLSTGCYLLLLPSLNGIQQTPGRALPFFNNAPPAIIIVIWGLQLLLEICSARYAIKSFERSHDQTQLGLNNQEQDTQGADNEPLNHITQRKDKG